MRNLLITGGAGFIGSNFVHYWLRSYPGDTVTVLDALTYAGNRQNLAPVATHPSYCFVHGDICDANLVANVFTQRQIDCVVHFAAESHVDRSITTPDEFIRTNVVGTHTLLRVAKNAWMRERCVRKDVRFHHVSTDEVYGSLKSDDPPFTETTPYSPNSPYSASKAASDHLVRAYGHTYGLPISISNCSNNYGPYQFPEKLIPLMLVNALTGKPLPIYGKGENVRDWLFVEDHCRAIDIVLRRGEVGATYNIGGGNERRNIDVIRTLCELLEARFNSDPVLRTLFPRCPAADRQRIDSLLSFVTDRPGHDWRYAINGAKLERDLGFVQQHTFESAMRITVDWYLAHPGWWQSERT